MNKNKQNPLLAQFEAQLEKKYFGRLEVNSEIDLIAFMLTINEDLQVGPGRAGKLCSDFLENKKKVALIIKDDYGDKKDEGDKELLHTKKTFAMRLRKMFSLEDWLKHRVHFPLLIEYWDIEV